MTLATNWLSRWFSGAQAHVVQHPHLVVLPSGWTVVIARTLDCIGAGCPRPQLLTLKVLAQLQEGEVIELLSDNPSSVETLPSLMLTICSTHVATVRHGDHWRVYMRKGL